MEGKTKALVTVLVLIIVVLLGIVLYAFVVKPTISGYVVQGQNEGLEFAVVSIMQRAGPPLCQPVPLFYNNQTISVISVECLQVQQTQQQIQEEQTGQ